MHSGLSRLNSIRVDSNQGRTLSELTFDAYVQAIRVAEVVYLKTGPTTAHWRHELCSLETSAIQFGSDGSPRIVHGTMPPDTCIFIFQSTQHPDVVILDGQLIHWSDLVVLPPSHHFTFVVNVPVSWIAVSLPIPTAEKMLFGSRYKNSNTRGYGRLTCRVSESSMRELVKIAEDARLVRQDATQDKVKIEADLLSKLRAMMEVAVALDRPSPSASSAEGLIRDALTYVERKEAKNIQVDDLVNVTQVEYRTLLRAFQRYLRITPKRYLKLRQLNLVRRALHAPQEPSKSALDIMADFGVTEFGRFAADYKRLFDELPSETLGRASPIGGKILV